MKAIRITLLMLMVVLSISHSNVNKIGICFKLVRCHITMKWNWILVIDHCHFIYKNEKKFMTTTTSLMIANATCVKIQQFPVQHNHFDDSMVRRHLEECKRLHLLIFSHVFTLESKWKMGENWTSFFHLLHNNLLPKIIHTPLHIELFIDHMLICLQNI